MMQEFQRIQNTVQRFFAGVDAGDWDGVAALMADPFHIDYSSYGGGPAAQVSPQDVLSGWKAFLPGFDAVHHQLGPLDITLEDAQALVKAHGTATHYIADVPEGSTGTIIGTYDLTLQRAEAEWLLTGMTFYFKFQSGNPALSELAAQRAAV
ncbi:MAG: nuclear transport factor 2 family protein [Rhodospirillaceae bacterium]